MPLPGGIESRSRESDRTRLWPRPPASASPAVTLSERLERGLTARRRTWLVRLLWVVVAAAVCVRVGVMLADPIQPTG